MTTRAPRRVRLLHCFVMASFALAGCASGSSTNEPPDPQGPPAVQPDVVAEHAAQFDDVLADRPAGSQREFAAATYVLGHLQTAGYAPLLDPVPVKDLVRSTNVVAEPPAGEPDVVVAVAYDTSPDVKDTGSALGLWLELARSAYARDQEHAIEFVALGAENTRLDEGNLGSRRLVEFLRDDELSPLVVTLGRISPGDVPFSARGEGDDELVSAAARLDIEVGRPPAQATTDEVFDRAGFREVSVSGGVESVARVLLEVFAAVDGASASPS